MKSSSLEGMMSGLEGVVVSETHLSRVEGASGVLVLRGWSVADLAAKGRLEHALDVLWDANLSSSLGEARMKVWASHRAWAPALELGDGIAAQQVAIGLGGFTEPMELVACVGVVAAAWIAGQLGRVAESPDPTAHHAADLLRMSTGELGEAQGAALGSYLSAVSDHGMNASTFAGRVVASTAADLGAVTTAALSALKGPLHGGAPGPVLDLLDRIGTPERAEEVLRAELDAGRRIMGMGHRVYRVRDPRAAVLEDAIATLPDCQRVALAQAVERQAESLLLDAHPGRPLKANVEFYTAVLLDALGLPRAGFTPLFAAGRVVGWLAHAAEQAKEGRLMRPRSRYVGPPMAPTPSL